MNKRSQQILAYGFGVVFLVTMLVIAIKVPNPSPFQFFVFRVTLSLAAAGCAAMIPGFLHLEVSNAIRAGGALAVFAMVYAYNPASLVSTPEVKFSKVIRFKNVNIRANVESNPLGWNYGFTSVDSDPTLVGSNVIVRKIKVILDVDCVPDGMNIDVWAFFGPTDFGLPTGQVNRGPYPGYVLNGANGNANPTPPTQLKTGIGADHCLPKAWAQYDFSSGLRSGSPRLESLKESFNPPMTLTEGLFSQVFIWTGDPRFAVQIHGAAVEVEGTLSPASATSF